MKGKKKPEFSLVHMSKIHSITNLFLSGSLIMSSEAMGRELSWQSLLTMSGTGNSRRSMSYRWSKVLRESEFLIHRLFRYLTPNPSPSRERGEVWRKYEDRSILHHDIFLNSPENSVKIPLLQRHYYGRLYETGGLTDSNSVDSNLFEGILLISIVMNAHLSSNWMERFMNLKRNTMPFVQKK